jgi:glycerol-3-phosphate acyltransferase PlsX
MDDHNPANAVKAKPDCSMVVGVQMLKRGETDAFVTAGHSGGALAAALLHLRRIRGIKRPAIATVYPCASEWGYCFLLDIGANADCKPEYLYQFALMGSAYAERVLGIPNPRVAIVSNAEEEGKVPMPKRRERGTFWSGIPYPCSETAPSTSSATWRAKTYRLAWLTWW